MTGDNGGKGGGEKNLYFLKKSCRILDTGNNRRQFLHGLADRGTGKWRGRELTVKVNDHGEMGVSV